MTTNPAPSRLTTADLMKKLLQVAFALAKEGHDEEEASTGCDLCKALQSIDALLSALPAYVLAPREAEGCHGLDTPERVCFYEQDFYVLSNFSAFKVRWAGRWLFDTSEACYHWLRFSTGDADGNPHAAIIANRILNAASAHEAFKIAQDHKHLQRSDWDAVKTAFMLKVLHAKAHQHEYVRRKLLATGNRELVENSWRDDFWGWGPNRDGQNMLGKLWMQVREEIRAMLAAAEGSDHG